MQEHHLVIVAGPGPRVPARVSVLLMPLDTEIVDIRFSRHPDTRLWWIWLAVRFPSSAQIDLLIERLKRLVDVHQVFATDAGSDVQHKPE